MSKTHWEEEWLAKGKRLLPGYARLRRAVEGYETDKYLQQYTADTTADQEERFRDLMERRAVLLGGTRLATPEELHQLAEDFREIDRVTNAVLMDLKAENLRQFQLSALDHYREANMFDGILGEAGDPRLFWLPRGGDPLIEHLRRETGRPRRSE